VDKIQLCIDNVYKFDGKEIELAIRESAGITAPNELSRTQASYTLTTDALHVLN